MDIENLNKMQIILLTLLISFVTSIATGIVTVTLMDQAPPAVVQTIHKVVEKTVETVIPDTQIATVEKEVIVIKEQNLVADALEKNSESIIKINDEDSFVGSGIMVNKKGIILTGADNIKIDGQYSFLKDDIKLDLELLYINEDKNVAYLKVVNLEEGIIFKTIFKVVDLENTNTLKLGQSVVLLNQSETTEVLTGIISGLIEDKTFIKNENVDENATTTDEKLVKNVIISKIKTDLPKDGITKGAALLDIEGKVIGINIDSTNIFITLDFVKDELKTILDSQKETNLLTE